ncbi:MAG: Resolvase domain protein [Gemmataceae bacterium]|nr:Resolvase domain protein [Gemmataceae bacterium]
MRKPTATSPPAPAKVVRCAVYTRKSTEEGLDQAFNSLDAQREAGEAYVRSQAGEGWVLLPTRYDDGGFTGGNTDRPALRRLMADIAAGKVDCVVVYKVDRLSRSLLDFAGMMQTFEAHTISFVSVTQQFNTGTSMGRLVLNVLLSFAQFEREIISERTRDKIAATRRKGKWAGGHPVLGYDVDPRGHHLVVNTAEADRVRAIFDLYLEHQSLLPVVQELARRGWANKRWRTRKGPDRGGAGFTRTNLYKLLTNVVYVGQVRYKAETHPGEHPGIVDPVVFDRVQALLRRNGATGGVRTEFGALLAGVLRCRPCGCAMTPTHTTKGGTRRYRYYVCTAAQKKGWATCPSRAVPAGAVDGFVVDRLRGLGRDPGLVKEILAEVRERDTARQAGLAAEERELVRELTGWHREVAALASRAGGDGTILGKLADLHDRIGRAEGRVREVREQMQAGGGPSVDADAAASALTQFDPVWAVMTPKEQGRVVRLLVDRVEYDGADGRVAVVFRPTGIQSLAADLMEDKGRSRPIVAG